MHEDGVFDGMVAASYDDDDAISAPEVVDQSSTFWSIWRKEDEP